MLPSRPPIWRAGSWRQQRRWGPRRERVIRLLGGASARLRPQRARCRSCGRTHILPPSWCEPRRADGIEVIGTAAAAALAGADCGRIGQELGVPASTVRGWLRRLRSRAEEMRQDAMFQLGLIGGADPVLPEPSGSPLGNALSVVAAAAHAAITGCGFTRADLWAVAGPVRRGPPPRARQGWLTTAGLPAGRRTGMPAARPRHSP